MIIEDQTVEVKVWDHNDAVIFVYENIHEKTDEIHESGVPVWRSYKKVVTAIPVNFTYCDSLSNDDKLVLVRKVSDALTELYNNLPDENANGQARYCVDVLKPQMELVRELSDTAERLVAADLWPFPKYSEILFHHHSGAPEEAW